jgi:phosphoribosylpyrophosphate synthetase
MIILVTNQAKHIGSELEKRYHDTFDFYYEGSNRYGRDEFDDSHQYTRLDANIEKLERLHGEDVVIVHCALPRPNSSKDRLYKLIRAVKEPQYSKGKVEVTPGVFEKQYWRVKTKAGGEVDVEPKSIQVYYLFPPDAKQDWVDLPGAVNAAELHLDICEFLGASTFYFLDAHFEGADWLKKYKRVINSTVQDKLIEEVKKYHPDVIFLGADQGQAERALLRGIEMPSLIKTRTGDSNKNKVFVPDHVKKMIKGKKVCPLDDLGGTGGTQIDCINALYACGVEGIWTAFTHVALPQSYPRARSRLQDLYPSDRREPFGRVYVSNSVSNQQTSAVDVTDTLVKTLKENW